MTIFAKNSFILISTKQKLATPKTIQFNIVPKRITRDLYAFNGNMTVLKDLFEDTQVSSQLYRSLLANNEYILTPYQIEKQSIKIFLNSVYNAGFMEFLKNCSTLPQFEGEWIPPFYTNSYQFNNCVADTSNLPGFLTNGYYKYELNVFHEMNKYLFQVFFKIAPEIRRIIPLTSELKSVKKQLEMENRYPLFERKKNLIAPLACLIKSEIQNEIKNEMNQLDAIYVKKSDLKYLNPYTNQIPRSISEIKQLSFDYKKARMSGSEAEIANSLARLKCFAAKTKLKYYNCPKMTSDELILRFRELETRIKAVLKILEPSLCKRRLLNDECTKLKTFLDNNGFNNIKNDILYINNIINKFMRKFSTSRAKDPINFVIDDIDAKKSALNKHNNKRQINLSDTEIPFLVKSSEMDSETLSSKEKKGIPTKETNSKKVESNKMNTVRNNIKEDQSKNSIKSSEPDDSFDYNVSSDIKTIIDDIISGSDRSSYKSLDTKTNIKIEMLSSSSDDPPPAPPLPPPNRVIGSLESFSLNLDIGLNDNSSDDTKETLSDDAKERLSDDSVIPKEKNENSSQSGILRTIHENCSSPTTKSDYNIYDELYYQRRQNRMNFLHYKKSDRTINLNSRPVNVQLLIKPTINKHRVQYVTEKEKITFGCPAIFTEYTQGK